MGTDRFLTDKNEHLSSNTLLDQILAFNERKNQARQELNRRLGLHFNNIIFVSYVLKFILLDVIKKYDEEKLNCQVEKKFIYYATNEYTIKNLIEDDIKSVPNTFNPDFRLAQVKFAYALTYSSELLEKNQILIHILHNISCYKNLVNQEINFLVYLWANLNERSDIFDILDKEFPFTYEKIILNYCTEIIQLNNEIEVNEYFENMLNRSSFKSLSYFCATNKLFCDKIKNLINEIYFYSYCNVNLLKFLNLF